MTEEDERNANVNTDLRGRRVIVVGGAGYVGSVLVSRLLDSGAVVTVFDQLIYDNGYSLHHLLDHPGLTVVRGDLRDTASLVATAEEAQDVVLLASLVGDPVCKKYPKLAEQVNRDATIRAVDALGRVGVQRLVFTSTCSNYGVHDPGVAAAESATLNPQSLYARTKIAVEEHLLARPSGTGMSCTVLRLATAFGMSGRMRFDLTVSQFAWELATSGKLLVYDADTWRPYCHVQDIATAIELVLGAQPETVAGEVFNVGSADQHFTKRMLADELEARLPDVYVEYRDGDTDPRNYRVCFDKIVETLRFSPRFRVQDALTSTIAAVRAGAFPDVATEQRYGNGTVSHLLP